MSKEDRYDSLISYYAGLYGRMPRQVKRQIRCESGFNPDAVSPAGAKGLMQFTDQTWREWWDGTAGIDKPSVDLLHFNPFDPEDSIKSGCAYMAALQKQFGTLEKAIAAYNWGPGNLKRLLLMAPANFISALPEETRVYVLKNSDFSLEVILC